MYPVLSALCPGAQTVHDAPQSLDFRTSSTGALEQTSCTVRFDNFSASARAEISSISFSSTSNFHSQYFTGSTVESLITSPPRILPVFSDRNQSLPGQQPALHNNNEYCTPGNELGGSGPVRHDPSPYRNPE